MYIMEKENFSNKKIKEKSKKKTSKKAISKKQIKRLEFSSREFKVNLEQLQKDVKKAYDSMKRVVPEAIKNTEIKQFGNASHIILPKEYAGKKATVIIKEKSENRH